MYLKYVFSIITTARIMVGGDDTDRHADNKLPHDTGMPQGVDRHRFRVETGGLDSPRKAPPWANVIPQHPTPSDRSNNGSSADRSPATARSFAPKLA
jgi:hypothetical protein